MGWLCERMIAGNGLLLCYVVSSSSNYRLLITNRESFWKSGHSMTLAATCGEGVKDLSISRRHLYGDALLHHRQTPFSIASGLSNATDYSGTDFAFPLSPAAPLRRGA